MGRSKKSQRKSSRNQKKHVRSEDTLANTTLEKLRQCRTNPHANVRLSGKKKRKLRIIANRQAKKELSMEVNMKTPNESKTKKNILKLAEKMETS